MKSVEKTQNSRRAFSMIAALAAVFSAPGGALAQDAVSSGAELTYADLVDISGIATLVVRARIRKQANLEIERSPGLKPGQVRLYVEADTEALLVGRTAIGESLRYLVDVELDVKGKAPKLKDQGVILFAHAVPGRPSELQLITPDAQFSAVDSFEARIRSVVAELNSPDSPPIVTGIRDALSVEGNLAGESETQLFMDTESGAPVSMTIIRRPGMAPQWGVSWTELLDQAARPPKQDTLAWYRLACFLPDSLPHEAIMSRDGASRVRAAQDYLFVMEQLGPCLHNR